MNSALHTAIATFGSEAKAKLRNVAAEGEPEDQLEVSSNLVDRLLRSRGDLLLASFYQLSVFELGSGSHQRHQMSAG